MPTSRRASSASACPTARTSSRRRRWQLFVHDPNGVQLELTFHAAAEPQAEPVIAPALRYAARERWFDPAPYRQFATPV